MKRKPIRPGPGSFRVLEWMAPLGVVGVDATCAALGLHRGTLYSHVARLVDAGLVWRVPVRDGGGGVVVTTAAGARVARARDVGAVVSARSSAPSTARHGREVSWAAAYLELAGNRWVGPAELRRQSGWRSQAPDGTRHSPDLGIVHADGRRTALEVELHAKSNERLDGILAGYRNLILTGHLADVIYVTDRRHVAELVRRRAAAVQVDGYLHIRWLDKVIAATRGHANTARASAAEASLTTPSEAVGSRKSDAWAPPASDQERPEGQRS